MYHLVWQVGLAASWKTGSLQMNLVGANHISHSTNFWKSCVIIIRYLFKSHFIVLRLSNNLEKKIRQASFYCYYSHSPERHNMTTQGHTTSQWWNNSGLRALGTVLFAFLYYHSMLLLFRIPN